MLASRAMVVLSKAVAIVVVVCAAVSGYVFTMSGQRGATMIESLLAPYSSREVPIVGFAIGMLYGAATVKVTPTARVLILATMIDAPVGFALGALEAGLFLSQAGCTRSTYAPLLLPALLVCHDSACRRLRSRLGRAIVSRREVVSASPTW